MKINLNKCPNAILFQKILNKAKCLRNSLQKVYIKAKKYLKAKLLKNDLFFQ